MIYRLKTFEQYLFRKDTLAILLSIYTSYEANFSSHESQVMAPRLFTTFEMPSTLIAFVLDCDLSVAATARIEY